MTANKLVDARLRRVVLKKSDATWRYALGARSESVGLLLELQDSRGLTGIGYASESPFLGHRIELMEGLATAHLPRILAASPSDRRTIVGDPWHPDLPLPVRSMIDMAWWDLLGKANDAPLYELIGGRPSSGIRVNRILALKSPEETAEIARALASEGYDHFKIKVEAKPPSVDVARVRAVRAAVGRHAVLTVDANQSFGRKSAVKFAERIAAYDVAIFEQPVHRDDIDGLRYVARHSPIDVEADESATSLPSVQKLVRAGAVDAVSLKLWQLGGIDALLIAAQLCHASGIGIRIGAHVGGRILNAAAVHAAASIPGAPPAGELGEFVRLEGDIATGLEVVSGAVSTPVGPGLGVTVASDRAE